MTQSRGAQLDTPQLAWKSRARDRTLAQRRADLAAQMRGMALSDLNEVSKRLKQLHRELNMKDGREWTQQELADAIGIAYRTFQSWESGEVENRDGTGYDKIARWYSRKLGRKITRRWIVFGDEADQPTASTPDRDQLNRIENMLRRLLHAADLEVDVIEDAEEVVFDDAQEPPYKPETDLEEPDEGERKRATG